MNPALRLALEGFGYPLLLGTAALLVARRPWSKSARAPAWAVGLALTAAFVLAAVLVKGWPGAWPRDPSIRLPHVAAAAWAAAILLGVVEPRGGRFGGSRRVLLWAIRLGAAFALAWALSPHRRGQWPVMQSAAFLGAAAVIAALHWRLCDWLGRASPAPAAAAVMSLAAGATGLVVASAGIASAGQLAGLLGLMLLLISAAGLVFARVPVAPASSGVAGLMIPAFWMYAALHLPWDDIPWVMLAMLAGVLPLSAGLWALPRLPKGIRVTLMLVLPAALAATAAAMAISAAEESMYGYPHGPHDRHAAGRT